MDLGGGTGQAEEGEPGRKREKETPLCGWSGWGDSNSRSPAPKAGALPLGYTPIADTILSCVAACERSNVQNFWIDRGIGSLPKVSDASAVHSLGCRGPGVGQPEGQVIFGDDGKRPKIILQFEAKFLGIESHRLCSVVDQVSDDGHGSIY